MYVDLETMNDYESHLLASGLQIVHRQDLSRQCAKSWDLGLDIIRHKSFWALAAKMGKHFVTNLKAFQAMRAGYLPVPLSTASSLPASLFNMSAE